MFAAVIGSNNCSHQTLPSGLGDPSSFEPGKAVASGSLTAFTCFTTAGLGFAAFTDAFATLAGLAGLAAAAASADFCGWGFGTKIF
jgi:hypothetical protein